jgi:fructan beta-fructosidase
VWTAANDHYLIGTFDGNRFLPEVMTNQGTAGGNYYAVQTYSGLPNGRRVQLSWMKGGVYPHMPFNQQMSFPYELKLRRFGTTLKLCALPVREIESIKDDPKVWTGLELKPGANPLSEMSGDLWDIQAEFDPGAAAEVGFSIRGRKVTYTVKSPKEHRLGNGELNIGMNPQSHAVTLRILADRTTVEVFGNDGEIVMPACFLPKDDEQGLRMFADGGAARVASLKVYKLKSAWAKPE